MISGRERRFGVHVKQEPLGSLHGNVGDNSGLIAGSDVGDRLLGEGGAFVNGEVGDFVAACLYVKCAQSLSRQGREGE